MHTGEEFFTWSWPQYLLIAAMLASYLLLTLLNKLPSMNAFKEFADIINSAGGNILLLALLAVWSIKISMQFFYHLLGLDPVQFDKASSIITAGITYVQGGLSGMFIGALIKTLTGGKANGIPEPPRSTMIKIPDNFPPTAPAAAPAQPDPKIPTGSPTIARPLGFAGGKPIGDVGHRGEHGDLGTNNRT